MDLLVKIILLLTASRNVKCMPGFIIELENGETVYLDNDNNLESSTANLESGQQNNIRSFRGKGKNLKVDDKFLDFESSKSETGNTQMTVSIRGKIILPEMEAFTFPENSNLFVHFQDTSMYDAPSVNYGNTTIDLSNKASKEEIHYSLEAEVPNNKLRHTFSVSAVINTGWKGSLMDPNSEEWLREGDFFNDMTHGIQMKEGVDKYEKDITVIQS